jgi:subtilase-type serine protease
VDVGRNRVGAAIAARRAVLLASTALFLPAIAHATDFTVTNAGDTGAAGQLRAAINAANAAAGADRILFTVNPAITSSVTVSDSLTFGGAGSPATISGAGAILLNGAGSLTGNIGSNVTTTNQGALFGNNFASIGVSGGAWNLSVDGKVQPAGSCGFCSKFGIAVGSSTSSTVTVNAGGVVDAGSGGFSTGILGFNLAGPLGLGGVAHTVNINGGTVTATGTGGVGVALLGIGSTFNMTGGAVNGGTVEGVAIKQGTVNITGGTVSATGNVSFGIGGQGDFFIGQAASVTGGIGIFTGPYLYIFDGVPVGDASGPLVPTNVTVAGAVTGTGGTAIDFGTGQANTLTLHSTFVLNGLVDATFGANDKLRLGGTANGTFNVSNIGPAAQFRGFESFEKVDASTWTLTGTGAQNWTVSAGTLVGDTNSLGGPAITNNAALVFDQAFDGTRAGVISGSGSVSKNGAGILTLTGNNTFSGPTNIDGGTLRMGIANALSASTPVTVASGAAFDLNNFNQTIGSLAGAGNVSLGTATLTAGGNNSDTTFSGVMSGGGGFTKTGTGTMILSGANTFTGTTTISAGTLQLGNGGTSGSVAGNIVDNSILAINRSDSFILGNTISGTGAVRHNGTGTTTLTAANTFTGPTTVNAGTLLVNGSMASSSGLTVNAGATVGGSGNLPVTTINGGALSPGSNSIGTISITGSLTFVGAGNFIVEVAPAAADRTNVSGTPGTAALGGTFTAVGSGGNFTPGTRFTVLNATGGITGTFSNFVVSGNFGATRPHLEFDANNVFLVLDPNALPLTGLTRNQTSVATGINTALQAGNQSAPFLALFNLGANQLPGALDQLSGEVHPSTAGVLLDESLYARSAVLGRLRQASYGADTQMASLTTGGPTAFAENGEELSALAYAKSPIVTKAPPMVSRPANDTVFWAQGFGAWGRFDTDGNAAALRRDLAGFFSGVDTRVGANGRLGFAAGYTGSKNALDNRGNSTVDSGHVSGYGGWSFGNLNLRAGGAYSFHTVDTTRTVAFAAFFDTDTAHYGARTGQVFGEVGYGFAFGKVAIEPFAGVAWVRLDTDAFTERGGLAALRVAASSFDVGYSTFGIRAATMIPLANDMMLVPRASAAWQHAFDDVTPAGTLAFQTAGVPFVIAGVPIARDALLAEAGLDLAIGRSATIGLWYVGQIANNVHDHAAKGKFSWKF